MDILSNVKFYGNVGLVVVGVIEKDNLLGWLEGIDGVLVVWKIYDKE